MAKTTSKTTADHKIEMIALSSIVPSKTNPRKSFEKENIKDLAESMKAVGLLQPITVRPKGDLYEIVAGERRYKAAQLLKWETIPSMVRSISDDEMLEIQIIENLQREDVSPLDEAHAFKTLLQKESIEWLESKIHKSKKYISDRLKLNDLVKDAAAYVKKGVLPLGHAVVISKLSYADQQACLDKCIDSGFGDNTENDYCKLPLEELKDFICDEIMLEFGKVSFDPDDATLYPKAGPCKTCPKRTCNSNLLFSDITKDDKCTDAACFNEKINLHIARAKAEAKEKFGKVLTGEKGIYQNSSEVKVQGTSLKFSEAPIKNGVPVVITKSDRFGKNILGTTVYVDGRQLEKQKVAIEERKEEKKSNGWKELRNKLFKEVVWPRLAHVVNTPFTTTDFIIAEYFRDKLESLDEKHTMALAGLLGFNGFAKTPDDAISSFEGDGYDFEFRKLMYDKIIDHYPANELIPILYILERADEEDDEYNQIDHDEQFGFTWKELMVELGYEKPENKKK